MKRSTLLSVVALSLTIAACGDSREAGTPLAPGSAAASRLPAAGTQSTLSVEISGNDNIRSTGTATWEALPTGGTGTYAYLWTLERRDGSTVQGTGKTFSWYFDECDGERAFALDLVVTSGGATAYAGTMVDVQYLQQC